MSLHKTNDSCETALISIIDLQQNVPSAGGLTKCVMLCLNMGMCACVYTHRHNALNEIKFH